MLSFETNSPPPCKVQ